MRDSGADERSASALQARAKELANSGDLPQAEALLRRALPRARDDDERGLVVGTLAFVEAEQGRVTQGRGRCERALEELELSETGRALLIGQLGLVRWLGGETRAAVDAFSAAIPHLTGNQRVMLLMNRGTARLGLAEFDEAQRDFEEGRSEGDPLAATKCANNLGYLHLLRGELVEALRLLDAARPMLEQLGPAVAATAELDRADALESAGLTGEAISLLRDVGARLDETNLWRLQAEVDLRLARLYRGDESVAAAERARDRFSEHGNEVDADEARALALDARSAMGQVPEPEALEEVAVRLAAAGRGTSAQALGLRAAGIRGEMPERPSADAPLTTQLLAGEVAAEVALRHGDPRTALRAAAESVDELERWQRTIGSLELQAASHSLGQRVIRLGQRAALNLGDPQALLDWSERARELVARAPAMRPPEGLGALLAALRQLGPDGDPARRSELIDEIRRGRWQAGGSIGPTSALTTDLVRASLATRPGPARFVSLMHVDGLIVSLGVGPDGDHVTTHGPWAPLQALLGGLGADLAMAAHHGAPVIRAGLRERLGAIDDLLAPALAGDGPLVLTVPSSLARVPWGQLPSLAGIPVTLPTSASAWVRDSADGDGDGDFGEDASTRRVHRQTAPGGAGRRMGIVIGPDTRTGQREAAEITRRWDAWAGTVPLTVRPGALTSCAEAAGVAAASDVLHVCAHGDDREAHPLFASVRLADGSWFGHDVEGLPSVPEVVVLSACGVGGGSLGMARAWLHAGTRCVVAAPADIAESSAAERFPELHDKVAAGIPPAFAVAEEFGASALDCAVQCYGSG